MKRKLTLAAAFCLACSNVLAVTIIDIGSLGEESCSASSISENGKITGTVWTTISQIRTFVYENGAMHAIPSQLTFPCDINDSGQIVGRLSNRPAVFTPGVNTTVTYGELNGIALAINNSGQFSGYIDAADGNTHGFFYDSAMHDLGCVQSSEGCYSYAAAINELGQVAGQTNSGAFIHSNGVTSTFGNAWAIARGINNAGLAVGGYWNGRAHRAFMYSNGTFSEIRDGYSLDSEAMDINDNGQVVGTMTIPPPKTCRQCLNDSREPHAFLYQNGVVIDLQVLVGSTELKLLAATGINNKGQIVGYGRRINGFPDTARAFLLTLD